MLPSLALRVSITRQLPRAWRLTNKKTPHHRATRYFGCEPFRECSNNADSAATDANEPKYIVFPGISIRIIIVPDEFKLLIIQHFPSLASTFSVGGQVADEARLLYNNSIPA